MELAKLPFHIFHSPPPFQSSDIFTPIPLSSYRTQPDHRSGPFLFSFFPPAWAPIQHPQLPAPLPLPSQRPRPSPPRSRKRPPQRCNWRSLQWGPKRWSRSWQWQDLSEGGKDPFGGFWPCLVCLEKDKREMFQGMLCTTRVRRKSCTKQ